jgi:starch phosphorylase
MWSDRFHNVTNGISTRRFVTVSNPDPCALLTNLAGQGWQRDLHRLKNLERFVDDKSFQQE